MEYFFKLSASEWPPTVGEKEFVTNINNQKEVLDMFEAAQRSPREAVEERQGGVKKMKVAWCPR